MVYLIQWPALGARPDLYLTADGEWTRETSQARPFERKDGSELIGLPKGCRYVGPYRLDAWGNVAESQL